MDLNLSVFNRPFGPMRTAFAFVQKMEAGKWFTRINTHIQSDPDGNHCRRDRWPMDRSEYFRSQYSRGDVPHMHEVLINHQKQSESRSCSLHTWISPTYDHQRSQSTLKPIPTPTIEDQTSLTNPAIRWHNSQTIHDCESRASSQTYGSLHTSCTELQTNHSTRHMQSPASVRTSTCMRFLNQSDSGTLT